MKLTLKSAVWFAVLAKERRQVEISNLSVAVRNAFGADKKQFNQYLEELDDGD